MDDEYDLDGFLDGEGYLDDRHLGDLATSNTVATMGWHERQTGWWSTTDFEDQHDFPPFNSAAMRVEWLIRESAKAYLETLGPGHDADSPVFEGGHSMTTLVDSLFHPGCDDTIEGE